MNDHRPEDRIALLLAQGQAQRLGAQLAMLEAREQLAPLRAVATTLGAIVGIARSGPTRSSLAGMAAKLTLGHPWLVSVAASVVLRLLRRRPLALAAAAAAGIAAWWLLRPARDGVPPERAPG